MSLFRPRADSVPQAEKKFLRGFSVLLTFVTLTTALIFVKLTTPNPAKRPGRLLSLQFAGIDKLRLAGSVRVWEGSPLFAGRRQSSSHRRPSKPPKTALRQARLSLILPPHVGFFRELPTKRLSRNSVFSRMYRQPAVPQLSKTLKKPVFRQSGRVWKRLVPPPGCHFRDRLLFSGQEEDQQDDGENGSPANHRPDPRREIGKGISFS